jgi:hypothetical protein
MAEVQGEVRRALDELNGALRGAGVTPYRLELFSPEELTLLKKNARYMAAATFRQLVANVEKDRQLESLPLVYLEEDGTKLVLSGNHRVQAARKAKLPVILCLAIDWKLSANEKVAKQLSHNAIEGDDDLAILKELWGSITDVHLKVYSGIDERTAKTLESIKFPELKEEPLKFKAVNLVFLPEEADEVKRLFEVLEALPGDEVWLASLRHYRDFFAALVAAKGAFDVVNTAAAMLKLVEAAKHALGLSDASPMEGVRKTEVRIGEIAGQVPVELYQRWQRAWAYFAPKGQSTGKTFVGAFAAILDVLERQVGADDVQLAARGGGG